MPSTVTVCGRLQVSGSNTSSAGLTFPSPSSLLDRGSRTVAVGARLSNTRKVALAPDSLVNRVAGASMRNPGPSSRFVTATFLPSRPV